MNRLPLRTRRAMLLGIEDKPIIVGADGDPRGGVCPVYATSSPPSKRIGRPFARAWDRYGGARLSRPATERELGTLRSMLETSIELEADPGVSFNAAIAEHKVSLARGQAQAQAEAEAEAEAQAQAQAEATSSVRRDTGEQDRTDELAGRHGWAWLRPFRRYDEYEQALRALDVLAEEVGSESEPRQLVGHGSGQG